MAYLDKLMVPPLIKILPKRLKLNVTNYITKSDKNVPPATIKGQQTCRVIYDFFMTDLMSTARGYCDLSDLEWLGDDPVEMQEFSDRWGRILDNLEEAERISEKTKQDLFYRQVPKSKILESEVAWFRRHPNTDDHACE
jgi:hypothetical protein